MFPHSHSCNHAVLFYKDDDVVRASVTTYIASALRAGRPALVIAKPALLQQLTIELHRQHIQSAPFGPERGTFVPLDAESTLQRFCVDGRPDPALFEKVVGRQLEALSAQGKSVAAYGEMVGVLCERGQYADAVRLEGMWNALLAGSRASLYCGYSRRLFESPVTSAFYQQIRAAHTHVYDDTEAAPAF